MKSPLRPALQLAALFVLFTGAMFVGRSLPLPQLAQAAPIEPAELARPLSAPSWGSCGALLEVRVINYPEPGRVEIKCTNLINGVQYLAFKGDDQATASRLLSLFNTSMATGVSLSLYWVVDDSSSWGCPPASCRMLEGARLIAP